MTCVSAKDVVMYLCLQKSRMYAQKSPYPGRTRMMLQRDVLTYISTEGVLMCVSAKEPYVSAKEPTSLSYDGAEVHIESISKSNRAKKEYVPFERIR